MYGSCADIYTGRQRCTECLILIDHVLQKSPVISGSFAEKDLHLTRYPMHLRHPVPCVSSCSSSKQASCRYRALLWIHTALLQIYSGSFADINDSFEDISFNPTLWRNRALLRIYRALLQTYMSLWQICVPSSLSSSSSDPARCCSSSSSSIFLASLACIMYMHVCVNVHIYVYIYVWVYMYGCIYICPLQLILVIIYIPSLPCLH